MEAAERRKLLKMPIRRYFDEHFKRQCLLSRDRQTVCHYRIAVRKLVRWAGRELTVAEITAPMLLEFKEWLLESGRTSDQGRVGPLTGTPRIHPRGARLAWWNVRTVVQSLKPDLCRRITAKEVDESLTQPGSVFQFFTAEYVPKRMIGCKPGSVHQMRVTIRMFAEFLGRVPMLADLNTEIVTAYVSAMLDEGYARPTVNSKRGNLQSIWRYAWKRRLIELPPDVDKLKEYRRLPVAWTMAEFERIIEASRRATGAVAGIPAADYFPALLMFLYDTGLRLSAALSVEWDAFDPSTGWVVVEAEFQKQKVEQQFHLSDQTAEFVRAILGKRRAKLFPFLLNLKELRSKYSAILKAAGLPHSRKDKFHKIRRTTATQIAKAASIDAAAKHLGHSTIDVTKRYVDQRQTSGHDVTAILPRPTIREGGGRAG